MSFILGRKKKAFFGYLIFAGGVLLFGAVYESFSFGVYSPYMMFAFLVPLIGCVGCLIARFLPQSPVGEALFCAAVCTATAGSIVRGVLEIYGTTNSLWTGYPVATAIFAVGAASAYTAALARGGRD